MNHTQYTIFVQTLNNEPDTEDWGTVTTYQTDDTLQLFQAEGNFVTKSKWLFLEIVPLTSTLAFHFTSIKTKRNNQTNPATKCSIIINTL